ncbi:MAG TPA: dienelactone hydrolase family protein [Gemmatimonadaceae bacterium]|nr:dienelactone hydrolase family protein [Gemmatimonadaceae bacterium]
MRPHVLVLLAGVAACRPSEAAPIDDHDNPAVVAAVKAMAMGETAHLLTTDRRPGSAADSLRGDELVVTIRDAIGKYSTPDLAARDGYRELKDGDTSARAIVHFFNWRNAVEEAIRFNPAKPAALIYRRGRNGYRLLGATYTAPGATTEEALDLRVPLSVGQWHQHVDLCVPKPDDNARWNELGPDDKPVFGPSSSIDTQGGCDSVAGVFKPRVFGWMLEARVFVSDNPDSIWGWPVIKPRLLRPALLFVGSGDSVLKDVEARGYVVHVLPLGDLREIGDAITKLQAEPGVDSSKIGLAGMYAGAALVLHRAQVDKRVKAVVEFYGAYRARDPENASHLPPVLIVGSQAEAQHLDALLTRYNVPHERVDRQQVSEHVIDFLGKYLPPR